MNIVLNGPPVDPDTDTVGWWADGNRVTVRGERTLSTYTLPKGARRVTMARLGKGQSQLVIGGFKSVTVTANGPSEHIERLRMEVL